MIKKFPLSSLLIAITLSFSTFTVAQEDELDLDFISQDSENIEFSEDGFSENFFKDNINSIRESNPKMLENQPMSANDLEIERLLMQRVEDIYFTKEELSDEEKNELFNHFTHFIIQGFNNAADKIWDFSENNELFNMELHFYNKNGITPLMASAISEKEGGNVEYALKLIERGADPNQVTIKNNVSTLSLAATANSYKTLAVLMMAGADFTHENDFGFTPLDHAQKHESNESMLLLLNYKMIFMGVDNMIEKSEENK